MDKKKLLEDEQKHLPDIIRAVIKKIIELSANPRFPCDEEFKNYINDFFMKLQPEILRKAIMILFCNIEKSFNEFQRGTLHEIIQQIFIELLGFLTTKKEQFKIDFSAGKVQNETYEKFFKIVINQDITKFFFVFDQLFSVRHPENRLRCITICVRVKELLKNTESNEEGKKWIEVFNIDTNKYNNPNGTYVDAIYDVWQESVKYTVNQAQNLYPKQSVDKFRPIFAAFLRRCKNKPLKYATMDLIVKLHETLTTKRKNCVSQNKVEKNEETEEKKRKRDTNEETKGRLTDSTIIREIVLQIIMEFVLYSTEKEESYNMSDFNQKVPEELWKTCFDICKVFDINQHSSALDLLFCLTDLESDQREITVTKYVQSLIACEESFVTGVKWTFIFGLAYVKKLELDTIVYKTYLLHKEKEIIPFFKSYDKFKYLLVIRMGCYQVEKNKFKSKLAKDFVEYMTVEKLNAILVTENYESVKAEYGRNNCYDQYDSKFSKEKERRDNNLQCKLDNALKMLENEETYKNGIDIFKSHEFSKLDSISKEVHNRRNKYTNKIVYKSLIYPNGRSIIGDLIKSTEDKLRYLWTLDYYCSRYENNESFEEDEYELKRLYTLEELLYIFHKVAKKYKIVELKNYGFRSPGMIFYYCMKKVYDSWSNNIFGFCALHTLNDNEYFFHPYVQYNLFKMIHKEKRYACCWAQHLKVSEKILPSYLEVCECLKFCSHLNKISKYLNAEQFNEVFSNNSDINISCMPLPFNNYEDFILDGKKFEKMKVFLICAFSVLKQNSFCFRISDSKKFSENEDSVVECCFQGKNYKFITVKSLQALQSFIKEYLTKENIVGYDSESGLIKRLISLIQLSTEEWFCIIDVQEICKEITNEHPAWKELFEILFGTNILLIAFAAKNDLSFLLFTFPWLTDLLQKEESKILCLQKVANTILTSQHPELQNFFSKNIKVTCKLSALVKEVLNYEMDKTMQQSNWKQRPLTPFQKIYAVLDALVVVFLHKKLLSSLKHKLKIENDVYEIIQEGFVRHVGENLFC